MPPTLERLLTLPGVRLFLARRLARVLQKERYRQRIPSDLEPSVEGLFVPDLIGNDGRDFRVTVTNCWFHQSLRGAELRVDGRVIKPKHLEVVYRGNRFRADRLPTLPFVAGVPLSLVVPKGALPDGLHFVSLVLHGDLAPIYALSVPVRMEKGRGTLAMLIDPPDPSLTPALPPGLQATVHFVPHIHYDFEWLRDEQTFGRVAAGNLLEALRVLESEPETTFVIDQVPQLEALAAADRAALTRLAEFVRQERVEPLMGFHVEPDANLISGESLVRQAIDWQRYCLRLFGRYSTVGWLPDSFGMPATLPQILRKAGCTAFAFSRTVTAPDAPTTFMWEGLDGTRLKTHWMRRLYFAGYPLPDHSKRALYKLGRTAAKLALNSPGKHLLCPAGIDHGCPQSQTGRILAEFNQSQPNIRYEHSLPSRFFASLPDSSLPVVTGEFNPDNAGTYAARPSVKLLHRQAEVALANLERISLIADITGGECVYPVETLRRLRRLLMRAQSHDSITGCHTDEVNAQVEYRLRTAIDLARQEATRQLEWLTAHVRGGNGDGPAIVVVNTLSFWREEAVELQLPADRGRLPLVTDGKSILPAQVLEVERYADASPKRVRLLVSLAVPPLGYRTLWVRYDRGTLPNAESRAPALVDNGRLRNAWLEVCFAAKLGTICRLLDRERSFELTPHDAGRLTLSLDTGTLYLPYRPRFARVRDFVPRRIEVLENGPIRAAIRFAGHLDRNPAELTYRLACAGRRIDAEFAIDLQTPHRSLDLHWPLPRDHQRTVHEIPYGEIARDSREFPALNYVDLEGRGHGLAVLNRGTGGHRVERGALVMRLLRSSDKIHFHDSGPGGLALGRHVFHYSFFPHGGDARQAGVWRRGLAFNAPLVVHHGQQTRPESERNRAEQTEMLTLGADDIEVGAFYRDDDGIVLRLVERGGKDSAVELKPHWEYERCEITDLLGRSVREIDPVRHGRRKGFLRVDFRAWEIKTLMFRD